MLPCSIPPPLTIGADASDKNSESLVNPSVTNGDADTDTAVGDDLECSNLSSRRESALRRALHVASRAPSESDTRDGENRTLLSVIFWNVHGFSNLANLPSGDAREHFQTYAILCFSKSWICKSIESLPNNFACCEILEKPDDAKD